GGQGGTASNGTVNPVYGDFRNPNEPGSGGGTFGSPAGNGGGLIRIIAQTLVLNGQIRASGGQAEPSSSVSGGSGGGIRIDAGTISGSGVIAANGTQGFPNGGGGGSGGWIGIVFISS